MKTHNVFTANQRNKGTGAIKTDPLLRNMSNEKENKVTTISDILSETVYYFFILLKYLLYALINDIIFAALGLTSLFIFKATWLNILGFSGLIILCVSFVFKQDTVREMLTGQETKYDVGDIIMYSAYAMITISYFLHFLMEAK